MRPEGQIANRICEDEYDGSESWFGSSDSRIEGCRLRGAFRRAGFLGSTAGGVGKGSQVHLKGRYPCGDQTGSFGKVHPGLGADHRVFGGEAGDPPHPRNESRHQHADREAPAQSRRERRSVRTRNNAGTPERGRCQGKDRGEISRSSAHREG